jgi:hypothetical protein
MERIAAAAREQQRCGEVRAKRKEELVCTL